MAAAPSAPTAAATPALPNTALIPPVGALKETERLLSSSSAACFFARACLSLQVSFFPDPRGDIAGGEVGDVCSNCAKRLASFFGAGRETGVYAVPCLVHTTLSN
jgi:hypothetical protein